ncbi:pullulanase [Alteribacillus persepolensis]|uniref:Pullulanase n=1 Tax=Alteribacillus persepolensis TaxID=568899 RepID=A0A1G8E4X5_9BACI|nr:type I pullulanase [Alteribacillus persepolensis]SDH64770.1 pullulanase [Alteribacillus persepolensis]
MTSNHHAINSDLIAWLEDLYTVKVKGDTAFASNQWRIVKKENGKETLIDAACFIEEGFVYLQRKEPYQAGVRYEVVSPDNRRAHVLSGKAVRTLLFDDLYAYDGDDLGARCHRGETLFAVWAPTAEEVHLVIHRHTKHEKEAVHVMKRTIRGVWRMELQGEHHGLCYTYRVFVNGVWQETPDPYAASSTLNGDQSVVIDWRKIPDKAYAIPKTAITDAIIYEVHVRDFTAHLYSGVKQKGKYLGWTERDTKTPNGCTSALSYIKELGVTHVQLLPVHDFGSVDETKEPPAYNWGYDPVQHFVPEGSYVVNKHQPEARIRELKQLIDTLHQHGIGVILDVVLNHFYKIETASLEKIVPGYYFRYDDYGLLSNGTGVGNDTASERYMMRKYIIDCLLHWIRHYQVDGFRFDLMGIHDVTTMQEVSCRLREEKPSVFLYGEGWNMNTVLADKQKASINQAPQLGKRVGFFNDRFRNTVKGNIFGSLGFIHGERADVDVDNVAFVMRGSIRWEEKKKTGLFTAPSQSINYVECHDNHTLWDQLNIQGDMSLEEKRKMHRLTLVMVLTAQGVPFLHGGQEFFRTKYGVENSYNAPVWINQFDWEQREIHNENVEFLKNLIQIRKQFDGFRMQTTAVIERRFQQLAQPKDLFIFKIHKVEHKENAKDLYVLFNHTKNPRKVVLPEKGIYQVIVDGERASLIPLKTIHSNTIEVQPVSAVILYK